MSETKQKPVADVQTAEEAHDIAVKWQQWQAEQNLSMFDLAYWGAYFKHLAAKFPSLEDEFKENAII